jgi:hypothetical protein
VALRVTPSVGEAPLDDALAALTDSDADTATALREDLDEVLAGLRASTLGDVAWCASRLTPTGYPVELGFPGAGGEMRAVADVAGPEVDPHQHVIRALELAQPDDRVAIEAVVRAHARATLRYGAWIGVRASPATSPTRKLYLEAPRGSVVAPAGTTPLMVGVDVATGAVEHYVRVERMTPRTLAELLAPSGLGGRAGELAAVADSCLAPSAGPALSGAPTGFSVAAGDGGPVAAVHLPAWRLGRTDADVRARLLSAADRHGWDLGPYVCASAPLVACRHGVPRAHGIVAWVLAPDRPVLLHIGLTPPGAVHHNHR